MDTFLTVVFLAPIPIMIYVIYIGIFRRKSAFIPFSSDDDHLVILKMHRASIEDHFRTKQELENFVERLQWEMGNTGEVREINLSGETATVTIARENAEEMYAKIRIVMRHSSLSKNASVVLRYGPPGSHERRTHMAN